MNPFLLCCLIGLLLSIILAIGMYIEHRAKKKRETIELKRSALIAMLNGEKGTLGEIMDRIKETQHG